MKREYASKLKDKKILVVGMGRSGKATVVTLHDLGAQVVAQDSSEVSKMDEKFVSYLDNYEIERYFGKVPEDIGEYDMVVLSPGVPPAVPFVQEAIVQGVEVIGELELAYRLIDGKFVAITGTNGKTTTTTLVGDIFEVAKRNTAVVGNIGVAAMSRVADSAPDEWLVTEASSFQLETIEEFKPVVSAILNITPDHLNRHKTMEAYIDAKKRIFTNQTERDYLVLNFDDPECRKMAEESKATVIPFSRTRELDFGAYFADGVLYLKDSDGAAQKLCKKDDLLIIGDHNVENVLAAAAIAYWSGVPFGIISSTVKVFPGVEHRIEYCGMADGIKFYNDSKGTNVDAAVIALKALEQDIILIAGGDGKSQDFREFGKAMRGAVKKLILLGRDAAEIGEAAEQAGITDIYYESDMNNCIKRAMAVATEGDKVLLSPACASWDMYESYEQRGRHFKECFAQLLK